MPPLSNRDRERLPDSAFAYIDSQRRRRLPINDAAHVRNALARFEQVAFEDEAARERTRQRLLRAARKFGIVPIGFFDGQLRTERLYGELKARGGAGRLPRGTVTFLFTDIEGSTRLLQQLGTGYAAVLREVRTVIRSAVRAAGGHEVDSRADEFFAVFARAEAAVNAATAVERALGERAWPKKARVRVRIGLHTGRPALTESGYVGIAVHTAARVCATAAGGEILLSSAVREAMGRPAQWTLTSLGARALPGIDEPVGMYRVG